MRLIRLFLLRIIVVKMSYKIVFVIHLWSILIQALVGIIVQLYLSVSNIVVFFFFVSRRIERQCDRYISGRQPSIIRVLIHYLRFNHIISKRLTSRIFFLSNLYLRSHTHSYTHMHYIYPQSISIKKRWYVL
jgi:hypothetical protein